MLAAGLDVVVLVPVAAVPVPVAVVEVTAPFVAQKLSYQVLIACRSASAVQLALPQTAVTPVVPALSKAVNRLSVQKQLSSTAAMFGGEHFPCTSKRGPQSEAHAGRPEVKGTIAPSATATCAFVEEKAESRLSTRKVID